MPQRCTLRTNGITAKAPHSELKQDERRAGFEEFRSGELAAICAARFVDEGLDVPDADLAIVVAASQQRRQMVHQMRRVLRSEKDGRHARFAIVFVKGTHKDPASGAHEAFFDQVLDNAEDCQTFEAREVEESREFLRPLGRRRQLALPESLSHLPFVGGRRDTARSRHEATRTYRCNRLE